MGWLNLCYCALQSSRGGGVTVTPSAMHVSKCPRSNLRSYALRFEMLMLTNPLQQVVLNLQCKANAIANNTACTVACKTKAHWALQAVQHIMFE